MKLEHIGMVGYGEVGKIFTTGLLSKVLDVSAWDLKFDATLTPATARDAELAHAATAAFVASLLEIDERTVIERTRANAEGLFARCLRA